MYARFLQVWDELRSSYWFIPLLMTAGAVGLAALTTWLDESIDHDWMEAVPFVFEYRPEGAREILATIAGSLITVAGVVFSITVAAVVYASGQRGARLLTNFMRDRGNQVTLGTFIATFLYCLLILRTVRGPEEPQELGVEEELAAGFVPHLGMVAALVLTLCSVGVLIYFIHHVPRSIHISNVVADIGRELRQMVEKRLPERFGTDPPEDVDPRDEQTRKLRDDSAFVDADGSGYVQAIDDSTLMALAVKHDLILRLCARPGDFVRPGKPIVEVYPEERASDEVVRRIRFAYAWGNRRTPVQDFMFLVDELVEIAARALSPGVNDSFTAVRCIDWLADGFAAFAGRGLPERYRFDEDGHLRVIADPITLAEFGEAAFGQLAPYSGVDRIAGLRQLGVIQELASTVVSAEGRVVLREQAEHVMKAAEAGLEDPVSLELFRGKYREVVRSLRHDAHQSQSA